MFKLKYEKKKFNQNQKKNQSLSTFLKRYQLFSKLMQYKVMKLTTGNKIILNLLP